MLVLNGRRSLETAERAIQLVRPRRESSLHFFGPQSPHLLQKLVNHGLRLCQELFSLPMSGSFCCEQMNIGRPAERVTFSLKLEGES